MRPDKHEPADSVRPTVCDAVSDRQPAQGGDAEGGGRVALGQLSDPCTSADLAATLGKSPKTVVDWCQERRYTQIPCFRIGNRWYHRVPELIRWLNGIKSGRIEFRRKPRDSAQRR